MDKKINLIDFINEINDEISQLNTREKDYKEENKVSELHTHKILFIVYGAFYKKYNVELFDPKFEAWKYGPVEIDYRSFIKENNKNILKKFDFVFNNKEQKEYLHNLIKKLLKFSPWSLVEYTHSFSSWINNYDETNKKSIPKNDIFESFKDKMFD